MTGFQSFNYDVGTHTPMTFDTLFKPGADPVAVLDPIVQREMDRQWQGYGGPAPRNTLGARTYQDFALTDDAPIGAGVGAGLGRGSTSKSVDLVENAPKAADFGRMARMRAAAVVWIPRAGPPA